MLSFRATRTGRMPEAEFRQMVRAFLAKHYPSDPRHMPYRLHWDEIKEWDFTLDKVGSLPRCERRSAACKSPPDKLIAFIEEHE